MINDQATLPAPTWRSSFSTGYWEATRDRRFVLQYAPDTGKCQFFPMPISQAGSSRALEWRAAQPAGELFAYTVTHRAPASYSGTPPYIVATVTLDAGVRMISNLVDCPVEDIAIGMRVVGDWSPLADGTHLLRFRPEGASR